MLDFLKMEGSFDIRFAIAALYLWLLFGFLSSMVSCDMQRLMNNNIVFRHTVGITAFLLLFTTLDSDNKDNVFQTWKKTIMVYFVFLLLTKSKWYFAVPTLFLIVLDQSINIQIKYLINNNRESESNKLKEMRKKLFVVLIVTIIAGFVQYGFRQYNEFGKDFNLLTFIFSSKCNLEEK